MLYTAPMNKPAKKPRLPDPNVFAFNVVQRITGQPQKPEETPRPKRKPRKKREE